MGLQVNVSKKLNYLLLGGLFVVVLTVFLIFWQGHQSPFMLDDLQQITQSASFSSAWDSVRQIGSFGYFRPVKNLIFYLFLKAFPDNPAYWRGVGIFVFLLSFLLVYRLSRRLFNSVFLALGASAIWALAPTQVSGWIWCSCLNIQFMVFFSLLALYLYDLALFYEGSRSRYRWLVGGQLACYFVAFFSYESAIVLPALLLLWNWVRRHSFDRKSRNLFLLNTILGVLLFALRQVVKGKLSVGDEFIHGYTPLQLSSLSAYFYFDHLFSWVWPFGRQTIFHPLAQPFSEMWRQALLAWGFLFSFSMLLFKLRKRAPLLLFGWAWFCIAFLPTSNLIPFFNGPFFDYYLILPSVGLAIFFVSLLQEVLRATQAQPNRWKRFGLLAFFSALLFLRILCVPTAFFWAKNWQSERRLYFTSLQNFTEAYSAQVALAQVLLNEGHVAPAEALLKGAMEKVPWYEQAHRSYISLLLNTQRWSEAETQTRSAMEQFPPSAYYWSVLGFIQERNASGRNAAIESYRRALALPWQENSEYATVRLVNLLLSNEQLDEALRVLKKAREAAPGSEDLRQLQAKLESLCTPSNPSSL